MRHPIAVILVAGLLGLACSSSSSSGEDTSIAGSTWCSASMGGDGFTFGTSGMCFYEVGHSSAGSLCAQECSYQVNGTTLTMTTMATGQPGCPTFDTTVTRSGPSTRQSCSFGC